MRQGAKQEDEAAALPTPEPGFFNAEEKSCYFGERLSCRGKDRSDKSRSRDLEGFSSHMCHIIGKRRGK